MTREPVSRVCTRNGTVTRAPVIAYVFGTRPNFVKMAPVIHRLGARLPSARHIGVHTGQHYDREMSEVFFDELAVPVPDHLLGVGSDTHGAQTARALERLERVMLKERPDVVVVPGDVNSTLAAALAAAKLGIPVAHIESGLRSFDWTMPEEINRVLVDRLSRWCFTHSPEARDNLIGEGIPEERVYPVGNTMIDSLIQVSDRVRRSRVHRQLGVPETGYLLVTLHRPALVDGPLLADALAQLDALSRVLPVVFPMHPRTRARSAAFLPSRPGLHLTDPVGYVDFLALEWSAAAVLTDSGGVQEETTFLGVPCFTLRDNTERPVTITQGTNRLLGLRVEALARIPDLLACAIPSRPALMGWDGRAGERVASVLADALAGAAQTPTAAARRFVASGA
jgi:UDP-N-acetylglucosamine 2-epimerase (non-hydrolysing)